MNKRLGNKTDYIDFKDIINKHDFIFLSETWSTAIPNIENYCAISINPHKKRAKSGRLSGGLSLLYKNKYQRFVEIVKSTTNSLWCKISKNILGKHKDLFICGIYVPPENSNYFNKEIFENLENEIDKFSKQGYILLLGDFNARTGRESDSVCQDGHDFISNDCSNMSLLTPPRNNFDSILNSHGKHLLDICKTFDLKLLNGRTDGDSLGRFTYSSQNGESTVDYIIADQFLFNCTKYFTVDKQSFLSDHSPISVWLQTLVPNESETNMSQLNLSSLESISSQYIWSEESIEPFKNAIQSVKTKTLINEFLSKTFNETTSTSVEEAVHLVNSIFTTASSMSLRLKQFKQENKKRNKRICNKKWFDFECKKARKELRNLSNQKHSNPSDVYIRQLYNHKLKSFKKLVRIKKYNFHQDNLHNLQAHSESSSFWKILKSSSEEYHEESIPPISEQNWIDHFTKLHQKPSLSTDQSALEHNLPHLEKNNSQLNDILNLPINDEEIRTCVALLKNNKAAASDRIRNEMIRHSIDSMCSVYTKLFNLILKSGVFPDEWCVGSLTPIFKSGDVSDTNNYRGICVSSCLGKFFTAILNRRLLNYVQQNSFLHNSQIGFMPNNRTTDHIFSLRTIIDRYVKDVSRGKIYACFIDFKKAFDSVWHVGLLTRLLNYNINGQFYQLIKNLYSKSKSFIKLGSKRTKTFNYSRGVRQGCILSPMLFNLYLNELPLQLEQTLRSDPIILPNNNRLSSLLYADDLVLLSKSKEGLQNSINTVSKFCDNWKMDVNEKKSKVMIFSKKACKKNNQPIFTINKKAIEIVNEFTYLGIKLSSTGNFNAHLNQSKEKALHAFYKLTQLTDFKQLKPNEGNRLFDSLISPILTYGCEVWGSYQKHNFDLWDKLPTEKVHLRFCKYFLGINKKASNIASRSELGRFPLKIFVDTLTLKFYNHLITLPDDSIAKQTFLISKSLLSRNKPCFHSNLQTIFDLYKLGNITTLNDNIITNHRLQEFVCKMKEQYFEKWKNDLANSSKLEFFTSFKDHYESEHYLNIIENFDQRRYFTKLRISNHNLAIETGRYDKTPVTNRLCLLCSKQEIETELHLIYHCPFYSDLRKEFYSKIDFTDSAQIDYQTFTSNLFNSNNKNTILHFSKFIYKCFNIRQNELQ